MQLATCDDIHLRTWFPESNGVAECSISSQQANGALILPGLRGDHSESTQAARRTDFVASFPAKGQRFGIQRGRLRQFVPVASNSRHIDQRYCRAVAVLRCPEPSKRLIKEKVGAGVIASLVGDETKVFQDIWLPYIRAITVKERKRGPEKVVRCIEITRSHSDHS